MLSRCSQDVDQGKKVLDKFLCSLLLIVLNYAKILLFFSVLSRLVLCRPWPISAFNILEFHSCLFLFCFLSGFYPCCHCRKFRCILTFICSVIFYALFVFHSPLTHPLYNRTASFFMAYQENETTRKRDYNKTNMAYNKETWTEKQHRAETKQVQVSMNIYEIINAI